MSEYNDIDADTIEEIAAVSARLRELEAAGVVDDVGAPYIPVMVRSVQRAMSRKLWHMVEFHGGGSCDGWTCGVGRTHRIPPEDIVRMRRAICD